MELICLNEKIIDLLCNENRLQQNNIEITGVSFSLQRGYIKEII